MYLTLVTAHLELVKVVNCYVSYTINFFEKLDARLLKKHMIKNSDQIF